MAADLAAREANFRGKCRACFDLGECEQCARGRALAASNEMERRRAAAAAAFDALGLPRRLARYHLESYPGDRGALAALGDFLAGWDGEEGLMLGGEVGVGKTGLLVGALRRLLADRADLRGHVVWVRSVDLTEELKGGFDDGSYERRLERLRTVRVLAIDDLGAESVSDWGRDRLFAILDHRYGELLPTFITTNLSRAKLAEHIGARLADRLYESCRRILVPGASLRAGH